MFKKKDIIFDNEMYLQNQEMVFAQTLIFCWNVFHHEINHRSKIVTS